MNIWKGISLLILTITALLTVLIFASVSEAKTQDKVGDNVKQLISTNKCPKCDLHGIHLSGAELNEAELNGANLNNADLMGANLNNAKLIKATLIHAKLNNADLSGSDLSGADLSGSDLSGADLSGVNKDKTTNLKGAIGI